METFILSIIFSEFHLMAFHKLFPPHNKRQQIEILQSLVLPMPEPTALLLCNLFIICKKLLHCITTQIVVHNAGSKNEFLKESTSGPITEEQWHRCKPPCFFFKVMALGSKGL